VRPSRGVLVDLCIVLLFCLLALAIRWPLVDAIPRYTDETGEVATALAIAFDGARPLVHNDAYRGPFWAYLLGTVLAITGPQPGLPRLFALALGALTVGVTYLFGRALAGRGAGAIAALLMATAFGHVVLGSHVAWSNNSTPLWTTLAALCLWLGAGRGGSGAGAGSMIGRGMGRGRGGTVEIDDSTIGRTVAPGPTPGATPGPTPGAKAARLHIAKPTKGADAWLALSGVLWGLALQSHPSVVALLPGAAVWFLAAPARRQRLRTPGPWIAMGLFVLTLSPMTVYNLQTDLSAVAEATKPSQPVLRDHSASAIAANAAGLLGQLGRAAGAGALREAGDPTPNAVVVLTDALRPAATWLYVVALVGALAWTGIRGPRLPACLAGSALVALTLTNRSSTNFYDLRYLAMLLPSAYAAVGAIAAPSITPPGATLARRAAAATVVAALIGYPLFTIPAYYARERAAGRANHAMIAAADQIAARAGAGTVLVDKAMRDIDLGGGGDPARAFDELLTLRRVRHLLADIDKIRWYVVHDAAPRLWIVAADATAAQLEAELGGRATFSPFEDYPHVEGDEWVVVTREARR